MKFKIWDRKNKKFDTSYLDDGHYTITELFITTDGKVGEFWGMESGYSYGDSEETIGKDKQPRFIIQQFSGCFDKMGNEIYEGDIVFSENTLETSVISFWDGSFRAGNTGNRYRDIPLHAYRKIDNKIQGLIVTEHVD